MIVSIKHNSENDLHFPNIKFKIYFDAKLLEVISVHNQTTLNRTHI